MALDVSNIRAITFDCYGTLIDWDGGMRQALRDVSGLNGCNYEQIVRDREAAERELLAGPYRIYSGILGDSLKAAAEKQGRNLAYGEVLGFVNTMPKWPPFKDSSKVLVPLAVRYILGVLSNVEDKVLETSIRRLGAPFVARITAQGVESYKPAPVHWEKALERLHLPAESVLHVAGSLYHDIRPARELGFPTAWINRRGEDVPEDIDPDTVFPDLAALAAALEKPTA